MKIKRIYTLAFVLISFTSLSQAQLITNFATSATVFGVWSYDSATSSLSGTETPLDSLANASPITLDLTGSSQVTITANVTTAPNSGFFFLLEDGALEIVTATFSWTDFLGGATITSSFSFNAAFDYTNVVSWILNSGPIGGPIEATLTSATAVIPEPSTYALLALGLGSLVLLRMRSKRTSV